MNTHLSTRPLRLSDSHEIEDWFRGDPDGMRFVSSYQDVPSWLELVLGEKRQAWLVSRDGHNIGFLDLEKNNQIGYFSYYVAPIYRGHRLAGPMLAKLESLARELGITTLEGYFEPDNKASAAALRKAAYTLAEKVDADGMIKASKSLLI